MSKILSLLLGKKSGDGTAVGSLAKDIREAIKGKEVDPMELIKYQTEINKMESQHRSVFVSGWRPFTGWICAIALAYNFVIRDLLIWALKIQEVPPALQMDHLMTVLFGMLGLGGFRTFEKYKNVSK